MNESQMVIAIVLGFLVGIPLLGIVLRWIDDKFGIEPPVMIWVSLIIAGVVAYFALA